jgi:Tat protein secretion system quality control protein TatD with DNase activity
MFLKQKNASTYFNLMPIDKILFETDAPYQLDEKTYNQTTKENLEKLSKISTIPLPKLQNSLLKNTMEFIKC